MNTSRKHVVERAYELARSPSCLMLSDVLKALSAEGYSSNDLSHFQGAAIRTQLLQLCRQPKVRERS
jgi:hypothetical protein